MRFLTHSEEETRALAAALAKRLKPGDRVLLQGDLGAGKSVFVRGAARALGVTGPMPSPTFTLMIPYEGDVKLVHFDLYRLSDPEEFFAAGLDEFLSDEYVSLIEWPEMAELDPEGAIRVRLDRSPLGDDARQIDIEPDFPELELWRAGETKWGPEQ